MSDAATALSPKKSGEAIEAEILDPVSWSQRPTSVSVERRFSSSTSCEVATDGGDAGTSRDRTYRSVSESFGNISE